MRRENRRKRWKKWMEVGVAGCMVLSLAACGENAQTPVSEEATALEESAEEVKVGVENAESAGNVKLTGFPICEEPITITVAGQRMNVADWNETDMVQEIANRFGIQMDCTSYDTESWTTQFTLMMASDELPDLCVSVGSSIQEVNKNGAEGYFLPLNEYMEYMPNFKAFLEEHPDYERNITSTDGNIYGLTQYNTNEITLLPRTFINGTWLKAVEKDMPKTVEELEQVLKAFKEQDANGNGDPDDEIPLSGGFSTLTPFLHAFGIPSNTMDYSPMLDAQGKVVLGQATENYKAMLKYLRKLYQEGLYDTEGLVQTNDELGAKCQEERVGMYTTGGAPYASAGKDISYDANWEYLAGLTSEYNDNAAAVYNGAISNMVKIVVSADTKYPEAIARLLDYFYTDEGSITASRGFEGLTHEKVTVDYLKGGQTIVEMLKKDGYSSGEEYRITKGLINEGFNVIRFYQGSIFQVMADLSDEELEDEELLKNQGWAVQMEKGRRKLGRVEVFPALNYTQEESNRLSALRTDIGMYVQQAFGQFIVGEIDIDQDWNTYLETLKQNGLEELLEIEQTAYDRSMGR